MGLIWKLFSIQICFSLGETYQVLKICLSYTNNISQTGGLIFHLLS